MSHFQNKNNGFTLLEMAMVVMIIGMVVGGIMTGASMLRTSHVHALMVEQQKYAQAIADFHDKYQEFPGDFSRATELWGTDSNGCPPASPSTSTPQKATCNGNGDGAIAGLPAGASAYETFRMWQHLANAGFIDGSFSGVSASDTLADVVNPGVNTPISKLDGAIFSVNYLSYPTADTNHFPMLGHAIGISGIATNGQATAPILSSPEMLSIDQKMDDGLPGTGKIITYNFTKEPNCASSNNYATARYVMSKGSDITCAFWILLPSE